MRSITKSVILAGALAVFAVVALKGAAILIPSGTWVPQTNLSSARANASAALLQDGRVLITGGDSGSGPVATADFFATDGTISAAPPMVNARSKHVAVTLQDGRVLVAGGITAGGSATSTAEIYDPATNSWTNVGTGMTEARSGASAALLPDGRVIIAGGQNGSNVSSTIEIFDPVAGSFSSPGTMSSPRTQHAMAVLHDGRVIITGGSNGTSPVASTDIFDPVAGTISAGPSLAVARFGHSATTLLNGQVVVIGGNNGNADPAQMDVTPTELFDPSAGTFTTLAANMATPREGHLAILLPNNNNVLIVGGTSGGTTIAAAELFIQQESSEGAWTYGFGSTGSMSTARSNAAGSANQVNAPTTTMQRNGILMIAGGSDASGNALNSTEAYGYATVQTDQSDYAPGTTVTITGGGWKPGETVNLQLVESPLIDTHGPFSAVADANGNISNSSFVTDAYDASIAFTLTAAGQTSGLHAQTAFTDAGTPSVTCTPNPVNVGSASTCAATVSGGTGDHVTWTHTGSGSFDLTSCTIGGSPNFSCSVQYTPSAAGSSLVTATDGTKSGSFTVTTPANLTATKSNNVSGSVTLPTNSWTWRIALANTGSTDATFANGSTVLHDDLPSGLIYGAVSGAPAHLGCSIVSNVLTCTVSSSTVTIAAGGGFTISFTTTDSANTIASFTNPSGGGSCAVDPSNVIMEATGSNTACSDTVTVKSATVATTLTLNSVSPNSVPFGSTGPVTFTATLTRNDTSAGVVGATVNFSVDGGSANPATTGAGGVATFTTYNPSALSVGPHNVAASFTAATISGTNFGASSSGTLPLTVNKATPTFSSLTASQTITYGTSSINLSGTISAPGPLYPPTSETVSITINGVTVTPSIGANGAFSTSFDTHAIPAAPSTPYAITYSYTADTNFNGASDASTTLTVNKATPTFSSLTASQTITYGTSSINLSGTISAPGPLYPPTSETVSITINGVTVTPSIGANGAFSTSFDTHAIPAAPSTPYAITYSYTADTNFNGASDASTTLTVNKATPTFSSLTASQTITYGTSSINLSGTISAPGPLYPPTSETVSITINGVTVTPSIGANGAFSTSFDTHAIPAAPSTPYAITYSYTADTNFNGASDASTTLTVNKATPTFSSLTASQTITYGTSSINLSGTISAPGPLYPPTSETVSITINGVTVTPSIGANGAFSTSFDTHAIPAAPSTPYAITYSYTADTNFNGASDASTTLTVNKATPTFSSLTASQTITYGTSSINLSGTISAPGPLYPPTSETVSITINGVTVTPSIGANGAFSTSFDTHAIPAAPSTPYAITYSYTADTNFNGASDASTTLTVNKADTSSTVISSVNPSVFGQSVTFTATVSAIAPGSGTPTGTVNFKDGATTLASGVVLSGGQATFTTSALAVGSHSITAVYNGDANFNATGIGASTAAALSQQVNYGFLGLQSPYMPPPTTFNVKRTMPLKWQYTNSGGAIVNSASANPVVMIQGPYACSDNNWTGDSYITVNDAGASGYQYDTTTNTWQFNWQIKGNAPGCYNMFIKSQQSGQTNGAFPISVVNQ